MALPWLIGGAIIAIGAAILSDDKEEKEDEARRERRRAERRAEEEAERRKVQQEQQRIANESKEKKQSLLANFSRKGEAIGIDIAQSLEGWVDIKHTHSPLFTAELNSSGYYLPNERSESLILVPETQGLSFDTINENLESYTDVYGVELSQGKLLKEHLAEIEKIDTTLQEIQQIQTAASKLKEKISKNA